jgi:hypothetical protein
MANDMFKDESLQPSSQLNAPIAMPITALVIDDERLAREELKFLLDAAGNVEVLAESRLWNSLRSSSRMWSFSTCRCRGWMGSLF